MLFSLDISAGNAICNQFKIGYIKMKSAIYFFIKWLLCTNSSWVGFPGVRLYYMYVCKYFPNDSITWLVMWWIFFFKTSKLTVPFFHVVGSVSLSCIWHGNWEMYRQLFDCKTFLVVLGVHGFNALWPCLFAVHHLFM